jgi:hypothetical protein
MATFSYEAECICGRTYAVTQDLANPPTPVASSCCATIDGGPIFLRPTEDAMRAAGV